MDNFNKELEWKNHNPFFTNLNKDLDELKQISKKIKDIRYLQEYYDAIENFIVHYAPYMSQNLKDIESIREIIYSSKLEKFLRQKKVEDEPTKNFYIKILDNITKLKEVHSKIINDVYNNGLCPRMNTIQPKQSELETDKDKKTELEALEQAGLT